MIDDDETESVKIALLGSAGVGKTSIICRYVEDGFNENMLTTTGGGYSQKLLNIDNKPIKLDIWDTAGQEQYRSLGKHFYKDAYIICLVYDVTREDSFNDIKNIWYNDLKKFGEKYTILALVGTKIDCYEQEKVKEEDAKEYAKEINACFYLTSAKTSIGINELFENLAHLYLDPEFVPKVAEMKENKANSSQLEKPIVKKKEKKKCCQS